MSPVPPFCAPPLSRSRGVTATGLAYLVLSVGLVPLFVVAAAAGAAAAASAPAGSCTHLKMPTKDSPESGISGSADGRILVPGLGHRPPAPAPLGPEELEHVAQRVAELLASGEAAMKMPSGLITVRVAARLLGVSERTVRRRVAAGDLPAVRIGRALRIDLSGVAYVAPSRLEPPALTYRTRGCPVQGEFSRRARAHRVNPPGPARGEDTAR
jgi:excisionase family DNA binding protein